MPKRTDVLPTPVATNMAAGRNYNGKTSSGSAQVPSPKPCNCICILFSMSDINLTSKAPGHHQGTGSSYLLPRTSPYTPQKTTNMDVNTTQVLTPRATNRNAFIFDLAPPCSYTMKLGTQHVFDGLICTNTQKMHIPV